MKKILIIDDEWNMRNILRVRLTKHFSVDEASNGREALSLVEQNNYDLIVLDIMMPDMNGWEVCKQIRKKNHTPIIMLTARNELKDKVHGLELGADDYLNKPFAFEELKARIDALIRRAEIVKTEPFIDKIYSYLSDHLIINGASREVKIDDRIIDFTPKEFDLLYILASQPKRVFTRELLLSMVWKINDLRDMRTVDTHIKNIRTKLRANNCSFNPIDTVWGVGYKFKHPEEIV